MNKNNQNGEHEIKNETNPLKAECPFCGLNSTVIIDPKQISDKKSLRLCLVCGHVFEYIMPSK